MADLVRSVWESRREGRHVLVESVDSRYAYVASCDPRGVVHERPRRSRILLDAKGCVSGYRQVRRG